LTARVAIVGIGQTALTAAADDRLYHELDYEAARLALADAGLDRGDLDTVICSGWDAVDGRTISDMHTAMSAGGYLKDSAHVGEDGYGAGSFHADRRRPVDVAMEPGTATPSPPSRP
jgi:acetyl-CoA acetyltransferase